MHARQEQPYMPCLEHHSYHSSTAPSMDAYVRGGLGVVYPFSTRNTYQPITEWGEDSDLISPRYYGANNDPERLSPGWSPSKYSVSSPALSEFSSPGLTEEFNDELRKSQPPSWVAKLWTIAVVAASFYSTLLSGLWCVCAVLSYRYKLGQPGQLSVQDASTIVAAGAKTIELSFVLVYAACIGQELSRRLTSRSSSGITVAQMQLKSFLSQPGSIITNWSALVSVASSFPGIITILAMVMTVLYTTASDALVSPKASMRAPSVQSISNEVRASFSNLTYMQKSCPVMIPETEDPASISSCDAILQTGDAFQNLISYLSTFHPSQSAGHDSLLVQNRPAPLATYKDLTSVRGMWLPKDGSGDKITYEQSYMGGSRMINNATMLLPHAGVVAPSNNFGESIASQDANGAGEFQLSASVMTPALNILCAEMAVNDPTLAAIVIPKWSADFNRSLGNVSAVVEDAVSNVTPEWYNGSWTDKLWGFSPDHRPPVFDEVPGANNTRSSWSADTNATAYILFSGPDAGLFMCGLTLTLRSGCSTQYHSTRSGGDLSVDCGADNPMIMPPGSPPVMLPAQIGFVPVTRDWGLAVGLGESADNDGSLARVLCQLWPKWGGWSASMPSVAEALGVLAASVVLSGAVDAPLGAVDAKGLPVGSHGPLPQPSSFDASITIATYGAGGTSAAQRAFFVVLFVTLAINVLCLGYLAWSLSRGYIHSVTRHGIPDLTLRPGMLPHAPGLLRDDLLDPQTLFGLALNSRPDDRLAPAGLAPLPASDLSQRWVVAGGRHRLRIQAIRARRRSSFRDWLRSVTRKEGR